MSKDIRLNVRVDKVQWAKLKKYLDLKNMTVSQWVRERIDLMRSK